MSILDNQTSVEKCGIDVFDKDKWKMDSKHKEIKSINMATKWQPYAGIFLFFL